MMTAEQARKFSRLYGKDKVSCELRIVQKKIEEATKMGDTEIWIDLDLEYKTKQTLKNLGYKLYENFTSENISKFGKYCIVWGE